MIRTSRLNLRVLSAGGVRGIQLLAVFVLSSAVGCNRSPGPAIVAEEDPVVTVASTTQIEIIESSLDGQSVADAYAVRSERHDWAHYVAARLGADSVDAIGLWLMYDGMDVPGERYAVDSIARRYSSLPAFDETIPDSILASNEVRALLRLTDARRAIVYPQGDAGHN